MVYKFVKLILILLKQQKKKVKVSVVKKGRPPGRKSWQDQVWAKLTPRQKEQFKEWFKEFIKDKNPVRSGGKNRYIRETFNRIQKKITRISNKYFTKGMLTQAEWDFVEQFSDFFGDIGPQTDDNTTKGRNKWFKNGKDFSSSWLIKWKWEAPKSQHKRGGKGTLFVYMKKLSYGEYKFNNFPYVEMVLLKYVKVKLGSYWWKRWMWRYSDNPNRFIRIKRR